jgi:hypothetical protein
MSWVISIVRYLGFSLKNVEEQPIRMIWKTSWTFSMIKASLKKSVLFTWKQRLSCLDSWRLLLSFLLRSIHGFLLGGYSSLSQNFLRVSSANTTSLAIVEPLSYPDRRQVVRRHYLYENGTEKTSYSHQTCLGLRHFRTLWLYLGWSHHRLKRLLKWKFCNEDTESKFQRRRQQVNKRVCKVDI